MPQMMPLNWMMLFFMFIFMFIMFNMLNYFIYNNKISFKKKINKYINNMNWKW